MRLPLSSTGCGPCKVAPPGRPPSGTGVTFAGREVRSFSAAELLLVAREARVLDGPGGGNGGSGLVAVAGALAVALAERPAVAFGLGGGGVPPRSTSLGSRRPVDSQPTNTTQPTAAASNARRQRSQCAFGPCSMSFLTAGGTDKNAWATGTRHR